MNDLFHMDTKATFKRLNSCYLPSSQDVSCQLHFGEISLADGLEEAVIADMGVLLCGGERVAASRQAVATRRLCRRHRGFRKAVHRGVLEKRTHM